MIFGPRDELARDTNSDSAESARNIHAVHGRHAAYPGAQRMVIMRLLSFICMLLQQQLPVAAATAIRPRAALHCTLKCSCTVALHSTLGHDRGSCAATSPMPATLLKSTAAAMLRLVQQYLKPR
jgi:hypothetical protein